MRGEALVLHLKREDAEAARAAGLVGEHLTVDELLAASSENELSRRIRGRVVVLTYQPEEVEKRAFREAGASRVVVLDPENCAPEQWNALLARAGSGLPDKCDKCDKTPWPDPVSLTAIEPPPPLELAAMPAELAEIVDAVAEGMQAPRELAWGVAVAVLATAIGKRAQVELPTHTEPSPIWTCTVLPPGSRKSAVFDFFTQPLADIEAEMQEEWREEWLCWKAEAELAEAAIQNIKARMRKGSEDRRALAQELAEERKILEKEPPKPLLFLTDTTPEALRRALHDHGSVGLLSAEGSSLLEGFGRYNGGNRGADMALFLAAHAGDADKGARVSGTYGVRRALASIGVTIQPDVLKSIGADRLARGRGLLDRFLFMVPEDPRGRRKYTKAGVSVEAKVAWARIVRQIIALPLQDQVPSVALSHEAAEEWVQFAEEIEQRQGPGEDLRPLSGFASKLAGQVARIALAYHLAQGCGTATNISTATMRQAIRAGRILIGHAKAARQLVGEDEATARARLVLECLARHKVKIVKPRDVYHKGWGGCRTADEARSALEVLCAHGYCRRIEPERSSHTGAQPKDAYEVHPAVLSEMAVLAGDPEPAEQKPAPSLEVVL